MRESIKKYNIRTIHNGSEEWFNSSDLGKVLGMSNIRKSIQNLSEKHKMKLKQCDIVNSKYKKNFNGYVNNRGEIFIDEYALKSIASASRTIKSDKFCNDVGIRKSENTSFCKEGEFVKELDKFINALKNGFKESNGSNIDNYPEYSKLYSYTTQEKIGRYRVDLYFKSADIIVEFDECNHKYNKENDKLREDEINDIIINERVEKYGHCENLNDYKPTWVRVSEGNEAYGILEIIGAIQGAFIF